jgi:hypothetical protein
MQPGSKEVSVNERVQIVEEDDLPELIPDTSLTLHI